MFLKVVFLFMVINIYVCSATSCRSSGNMCKNEEYVGEATKKCCVNADGEWIDNNRIYCYVTGSKRDDYISCCAMWGCDKGVHD